MKMDHKRISLCIWLCWIFIMSCCHGVDGNTVDVAASGDDPNNNSNVPTANEYPPTTTISDEDDDDDIYEEDDDDEEDDDEYDVEQDNRFTKIVADPTLLHTYITQRKWSEALARLQEEPSEASTLLEMRDSHGKVENRELPLHHVFSIDVPNHPGSFSYTNDNGGSTQEEDDDEQPIPHPQMTKDQIKFIVELIKVHQLGISLPNYHSQLPLHLALYSSVPPPSSIVELFIKAYPKSLRKKDADEKRVPLHAAVAAPMTTYQNVKVVLEADPHALDMEDADESLPLHLASWGGNSVDALRTIQLLLSSSSSSSSSSCDDPFEAFIAKDGDGDTPLVLMAKYGRTSAEAVKYMMELYPAYAKDYRSEAESSTLLHLAASPTTTTGGSSNMIFQTLLQGLPSDMVEKVNNVGQLPLHYALSKSGSRVPVVQSLLHAYPASTTLRDGFGYLPLHYACRYGATDIMDELLNICGRECVHVSVVKNKHEGFLPLHLSFVAYTSPLLQKQQPDYQSKMEHIILRLIQLYPEASKFIDPETKALPLLTAIRSKVPARIIKVLAQAYPVGIVQTQAPSQDMDTETDELTTPLHLLVSMGHEFLTEKDLHDLLTYFQEMEPECIQRASAAGRTVLHDVWKSAILENDENLGRRMRLFDRLLETYPDSAKLQDDTGRLPLHYACWAHDEYAVEELLNTHRMGAMVKSNTGSLPLHMACTSNERYPYSHTSENNHYIIKQLLEIHPDGAFVKDGEGNLPLHKMCKSTGTDHMARKTIRLLLDTNLDAVETRDEFNRLPIHLAAEAIKDSTNSVGGEFLTDLVRELLDAYPQTASETNNVNKTPLDILFSNMETLSSLRHDENDATVIAALLLFDASPESVLHVAVAGHTVLHGAAILVGDLGGLVPQSLATLIARICRHYPQLAEVINKDGRTPLHNLALYLGDTAVGARVDTHHPQSRETSAVLEWVVDILIENFPVAILEGDKYGYTPLDYMVHERLVTMFGESHHANSPIIQMFKEKCKEYMDFVDSGGHYDDMVHDAFYYDYFDEDAVHDLYYEDDEGGRDEL